MNIKGTKKKSQVVTANIFEQQELSGDRKMARAVGNALHKNPEPDVIPCFRVVNAKGECSGSFAFGGQDAQAKRLREYGIEVVNNRVDLEKYGW